MVFLVRLVSVDLLGLFCSFVEGRESEQNVGEEDRRKRAATTRRRDASAGLFSPWEHFLPFPRLHVRIAASSGGAGADDREAGEAGQAITPVLMSFLTSRLGRQFLSPLALHHFLVTWQHLLVRMSCFPFHHHLFQHTTNASSGNLQRAQHLFDGVYSLGGNYTSTLFNLHSNQ